MDIFLPEDMQREVVRLGHLDPRLAFGLAQCGSDEQSFGGEVNLTNAEINRPVPITFQQIPNNCFIRDFTYDVEFPNLAPGNLLGPTAAAALALRPGVDLKIQINQGWGPLNQVLNQDFQPIQHLVRNANSLSTLGCCQWLRGKFVWAWQSFTSSVILKRTLAEGENPMRLTFGLKVVTMPFAPQQMDFNEAVAGLAGLGVVIPEARVKVLREQLIGARR